MTTWDFIKNHADTISIILVLFGGTYKLNSSIADIDKRLAVIESMNIGSRLNDVDKRLTVIETVMLCNKMTPSYVVKGEDK